MLLSITPSFVAELERDPTRSARRIIDLKQNVDRPLSAILSLNTIAHTVGAAGVGAQATHVFGDRYVGAVSAVLTLMILVFSEIIPKTIGALHWRRLANPTAVMIQGLIFLMLPLVWLSEFLTTLLSGQKKTALVTRSEIAAIAALGSKEGLLRTKESRILQNLLTLEAVTVGEIMTPNTVIVSMDESTLLKNITSDIQKLSFSRIPIYRERRGVITGFVLKSDLLSATVSGDTDKSLTEFSRPVKSVRETDQAYAVFEQFLESREHIAIVTDDFGGLEGLVTLEDLVETLLGTEIVDEHDKVVDMQRLARNQWEARERSTDLLPKREDQPAASDPTDDAQPQADPKHD